MFRSYGMFAWAVAFGLAATLSGCGSPTSQEKQKPTTPAETKPQEKPAAQGEHTGHEGHEHDAHHEGHSGHDEHAAPDRKTDAAPADAAKGLAELSDADRAAAEKQRVCPVSGLVLGTMGKPYKVTVKGKTVFLCCPACEEKIMKDPDKYLEKLTPDRQA